MLLKLVYLGRLKPADVIELRHRLRDFERPFFDQLDTILHQLGQHSRLWRRRRVFIPGNSLFDEEVNALARHVVLTGLFRFGKRPRLDKIDLLDFCIPAVASL